MSRERERTSDERTRDKLETVRSVRRLARHPAGRHPARVNGRGGMLTGRLRTAVAAEVHVQPVRRVYLTFIRGSYPIMAVLIILVVLALLFGIGAVLEGLLWMFLIGFALLIAAAWFGWSRFRRTT